MNEQLSTLGADLIAGRTDDLKRGVAAALEQGVSPMEVLQQGLMPAMRELGERFSDGEAFLPELLLAADTMKGAFEVLAPALKQAAVDRPATLLIGTVAGDIHDLGKNLVKAMFEAAGFRVVDLGCDVPLQRFVDSYAAEQPDLVGLSSLLTSTIGGMGQVIREIRARHPDARFIVGGAPLSQDLADQLQADGYAPDAHLAVQVGKQLLER